MQPTLEPKITLFRRHPTLRPMCSKNPTKMSFLLEQSFQHITSFSRNLPTPLCLPESLNDDSPRQSVLLDGALDSLCESFSKNYSSTKGLRRILTVMFYMIVSKELREVNLSETYPAYHREKDFPERNQSYIGEGKSDTFLEEQEPILPRKKQRRAHSKRGKLSSRDYPWILLPQWQKSTLESQVINPAIQICNTGLQLEALLKCLQNDTRHEQYNSFICRLGTILVGKLVMGALTAELNGFLERSKYRRYDVKQ